MNIKVKIYSCYKRTYVPVYEKILQLIYGPKLNMSNVTLEIEDTSNGRNNIQSQRRVSENSVYRGRIIRVYEDEVLKHIIGLTNTNFDEDKKYEFEHGGSKKEKSLYGEGSYHANTYLLQGINQIFQYYFENKDTAKLSFYLLDTETRYNYPNNLYNVLTYRELETIGFKILNIKDVDFSYYETCCRSTINPNNLAFPSLNKFLRDIAYISEKNSGNNPSFMQCNEHEVVDEAGESTYMTEKYIYTFKSLSAQQYDSLLRCWCLKVLADKEKTDIEFRLGKQYFGFKDANLKIAEKLSEPVKQIFQLAELNINYVTDEEFMNECKEAENTYLRFKARDEIRNQTLFRNNIRKKGIPTECIICGEDDARLLDAAHLWEVSQIRQTPAQGINDFIKENELQDILSASSKYSGELFYKKYFLVNSGDNGVWLCKNHHCQFDNNYYCFESESGRVVLKFDNAVTAQKFEEDLKRNAIPAEILTPLTQAFLRQRVLYFTR